MASDIDDELDADTDEPIEADADDFVAGELQKRAMLRTLLPFLQARRIDSDPSGRVQLALDLMTISICDRVRRIIRSDLPGDES